MDPHWCLTLYLFSEIISLFFWYLEAGCSPQPPPSSTPILFLLAYGHQAHDCVFSSDALLTYLRKRYEVEGHGHMVGY